MSEMNDSSSSKCNQKRHHDHTYKSSPYIELYRKQMQDVELKADKHIKASIEKLAQNDVFVHVNSDAPEYRFQVSVAYFRRDKVQPPLYLQASSISRYGAVITYQVVIGQVVFMINMLNLDCQAPPKSFQNLLGKGGFGSIVLVNGQGLNYVKKVISLNTDPKQSPENQLRYKNNDIKRAINEYCIAKLCSILEIGPKVFYKDSFDLVRYNNSIEFAMQKCYTLKGFRQNLLTDFINFKLRMRFCLRVLHKLRIIHRDVKHLNTLYSTSCSNFVLCDFGVSFPIEEREGSMTLLRRRQISGTPEFYCQEIRDLKNNQELNTYKDNQKYCDLYYADLYALFITEQKIIQKMVQCRFCPQNATSSTAKCTRCGRY